MAEQKSNEKTIELPGDLKALQKLFKKDSRLCTRMWGIIQNSLRNGRHLNSVTLIAFGETGSGKSTTINKIFQDDNLCPTGNIESITATISIICKKMVVNCSSDLPVVGNLCFVDTPGTFDTNGNDGRYIELLKSFREDDPLLASRRQKLNYFTNYLLRRPVIMEKIYPNIVLFFINADTKVKGINTNIHASLMRLKHADLVDCNYPNLIVVITRGLQFLGDDDCHDDATDSDNSSDSDTNCSVISGTESFCTASELFKEAVRKSVESVFRFKDFPIEIVENRPLTILQRCESSKYYWLPNGELSHHNVLLAIRKIFTSSKLFTDSLGDLLVGSYLDPRCPERKQKATITEYVSSAYSELHTIESNAFRNTESVHTSSFDTSIPEDNNLLPPTPHRFNSSIRNLELQDEPDATNEVVVDSELKRMYDKVKNTLLVPFFLFEYLAHGVTFQSGEVKPTNLLSRDDGQIVQIGSKKYRVPKALTVKTTNTESIQSATFRQNRIEKGDLFIRNMQLLLPMFQNTFNFRIHSWNSPMAKKYTMYCFAIERTLATCSIEKPELLVKKCTAFGKAIQKSCETSEQTANCKEFFDKWGTNLVIKQDLGAAIYVFLKFNSTNRGLTTKSVKRTLDDACKTIFSNPNITNCDFDASVKQIRELGVKDEQVIIKGGKMRQHLFTFEGLNSDLVRSWNATIDDNPESIMCTLHFVPHYLLLKDDKKSYDILKGATETYNKRITKKSSSQTLMAQSFKNRAMLNSERVLEEENCFPKGTQVYVYSNNKHGRQTISLRLIEALDYDDKLLTAKVDWRYKSRPASYSCLPVEGTKFCTFLHKSPVKIVRYLCLQFSNGKELVVSEKHLILRFESQRVSAIPAIMFRVGDNMIFGNHEKNTTALKLEIVTCQGISRKICVGAYAPLTTFGTFFADGFLVTCYANVNSFRVANLSLIPLKIFYSISFKSHKKERNQAVETKSNINSEMNKIHPYAKVLMKARNVTTF